jgi:hypothetical protein
MGGWQSDDMLIAEIGKSSALGASMRAKRNAILFGLAALSAFVSSGSTAQVMGGGMLQPPTDPRRLTETGDPSLSRGDQNPSQKQPPRMSPRVNDAMKAVLAAAGQRDWTTAKAKLAEARTIPNPSAFDTFEIDTAAAFVAVNTGDFPGGLASYKKAIASPFFATAQTSAQQGLTLKNAIILANAASDFSGAIAFGAKLAAIGPVDDATSIMLAMAYFGNRDYATAKRLAQKTIDAAIAAGAKPSADAIEIVTKSSANLR